MKIKAKIYTRKNDSGTHYARIILPKELRAFVSKTAVWRSLSTKDVEEAYKAGVVTAVATRLVSQEVCDSFLKDENAVITVDAELVGEKVDLDKITGEVAHENLMAMAESLRASFGISSKSTGSSGKPSGGGSNTRAPSKRAGSSNASKKAHKKSAAGKPIPSTQTDLMPPSDDEVRKYIKKRTHGLYRFRYWIPRRLQKLIGQREVRRSLRTGNREEAIVIARPILMELQEMLAMDQGSDCSA
jgi:hypothetical protein